MNKLTGAIAKVGAMVVLATETIRGASANALAVGPNGTTNPTFNVDTSTASVATGLNVKGAAAAAGVAVAAISSGTNENLTLDAKGSGTVTIQGTATGAITLGRATGITGAETVTSAGAAALAVGPNGATNPTLNVDASTASAATGLNVKAAAAGSGVAVAAISSGSNEALKVDAKGTGAVVVGGTSTGPVILGRGAAQLAVESSGLVTQADSNSALLAASLLGGAIEGPITAARTYTTDTAANIDAAIPSVANGDTFFTVLTNTSGGAFAITLAGGTGVTLKGSTTTIAQNRSAYLMFRRTGVATYTCYVSISA